MKRLTGIEMAQSPDTLDVQFNPQWTGDTFVEPTSVEIWLHIPEVIQDIVRSELSLEATILYIQYDQVSKKRVVCFDGPPKSEIPTGINKYTKYKRGNYCYDGTLVTFSDESAMNFLVFLDSNYVHDI